MKKLYFYILATVLVAGVSTKSWAQEGFRCGHDEHMKQLWAEHPEMKEEYKKLFENSKKVVNDGFQSKTIFTIPVVFHIIHENGEENISDAQVYDQMEVLNRDYALLNTDISDAVAGFDTVAGAAGIQFKLAALDPWGNCTNGINHIYSHETNIGDAYSKLNQWPRARYLNIWVVKKIYSGAAGYSQYPTNVDGANFFMDGVVILQEYVGRIGTGTEFRSRAVTHEVGHWLALSHVWGDNNDPGVECGDDGVDDTPRTKGFKICPTPNQAKVCDPNIIENYQNYMDYSYCSIMFTKGQVNIMRNVLQSESGNRNMLITDSVHHLTGIDLPTVPLCAPIADFSSKKASAVANIICVGDAMTFTDISWNGVVENREWSIQDATVSSTTTATTTATFTSEGWKKVSLTVSNAAGTDTKTVEKSVYVYPSWSMVDGLKNEDFETETAHWTKAVNPEPESPGFELDYSNGVGGSTCYALINYKQFPNAQQYTNEYFYNLRKGGAKDYLYLPSFGLKYVTGGTFSFDYAYASEAFQEVDITETLELQSSTNCGQSWTPRKTLTKMDLLTGGNSSDKNFVPNASQWKNASFSIPSALQTSGVLFRFVFTSSDLSNNLYIDNVNITGTLMTSDNEFAALGFNVYPNPTTIGEGIFVDYNANDKDVTLELTDLSGKIISTETVTTKNTSVSHKINTSSSLSAGVYLVKLTQGTSQLVKKVVIL